MKVTKVVLDTSIFVNPDARVFFGKTPYQAFYNFLETVQKKKTLQCYMPPSVYEELMKFVEKPLPTQKIVVLNKKPPASYQTAIPALLLYEFIEETRNRVNKGLRIAEKYTRKALKIEADPQKDQEIIKGLREEYQSLEQAEVQAQIEHGIDCRDIERHSM